jgi:hypothetical protein
MSEPRGIEKIERVIRRALLRAFPPCREVVHIISASLDRPLTWRESLVMKMHLLACKPCVRYLDQSSFIASALKLMNEEEKDRLFSGSLRKETRAKIKRMLRTGAMSF